MKKICIALGLALCLAASAGATTVTDLVGDQDGFGYGYVDGQSIDWTTIGSNPADPDGLTDTWVSGSQSWSHTYSLAGLGPLTCGWLELQTAGQGWQAPGLSELYIDGTLIGTLTDGDTTETDNRNWVRLDVFDLTPYLAMFNGANTVTVNTYSSGDGWSLDYSLLTLSDSCDPVPEPASMTLMALGLAGMAARRLRKK